jgi:hypothetical protein
MAAESDLEKFRRESQQPEAAVAKKKIAAVPGHAPAQATPAGAGPAPGGPAPPARRVTMVEDVEIQIDGGQAKLIDLSITGAQILSPSALKPNRVMTLKLQAGDNLMSCKGKIMWSRLEPSKGGELWYRAGIAFTIADQAALKAFIESRAGKE